MKNLLTIILFLIIQFVGFSQDPGDPFMRHSMLGVDNGTNTPVDAKTKLCGDLTSFSSTLKTFNNLDEKSKVEQYKNVQKLVDQSWNNLSQSSAKLPSINIEEVKVGYENLKELISSLNVATDVIDATPKIAIAVDQTLSDIEIVKAESCR